MANGNDPRRVAARRINAKWLFVKYWVIFFKIFGDIKTIKVFNGANDAIKSILTPLNDTEAFLYDESFSQNTLEVIS